MLQTFRNSLFIPGFPASAWERNYPLYSSARQLHSASFSYETGQTNGILYLPPRLPKSALKYLFLPFRNRNSSNTI